MFARLLGAEREENTGPSQNSYTYVANTQMFSNTPPVLTIQSSIETLC